MAFSIWKRFDDGGVGQGSPKIATLPDGGFVATWIAYDGQGKASGVYVQRYDRLGNALDEPQAIQQPEGSRDFANPDIIVLEDGSWVVAWTLMAATNTLQDVYYQCFDVQGQAVGPSAPLSAVTATNQTGVSLVALTGGGWAASWRKFDHTATVNLYHRRFDAAGTPLDAEDIEIAPPQQFARYTSDHAALPNDGWVTVWNNKDGLFWQRFTAEGKPARDQNGDIIPPEMVQAGELPFGPTISLLANGDIVVTWGESHVNEAGRNESFIYQRRYTGNGPTDVEQIVATPGSYAPTVTPLTDGGWVVTWYSSEPGAAGIYQKRYDSEGNVHMDATLISPGAGWSSLSVVPASDGAPLATWSLWTGQISRAYLQRLGETADETLRIGSELARGTDADETLSVAANGLDAGDSLDGGGGTDTLALLFEGTLNLARPAELTNFEIARGSSGNDTIIVNQARFAALETITGGGGVDTLQLAGGGTFDLSAGASLAGFAAIAATSTSGTHVKIADKANIGLLRAHAGASDQITLTGGVFTQAERNALFAHGFEVVADESGAAKGGTVAEDAPVGTAIVSVSTGAGDTATYTLVADGNGAPLPGGVHPHFEIATSGTNAGKLVLRTALDDAQVGFQEVWVRVERGGVVEFTKVIVTVTNANEAPDQLTLTGNASVLEGAANGTLVGQLSSFDPDQGDTITYQLTDDAGGRFGLAAGQIIVKDGSLLDHEQSASHAIKVQATDAAGLSTEKTFVISVGDVSDESVQGTPGSDSFLGGSGKDTLKGSSGDDKLEGGSGNDQLWGQAGKDMLSGGKGKDVFVFDTKPSKADIDRILDFKSKDDSIWLENKIFTKLGKKGNLSKPAKLKKDYFAQDKPKDGNDYIIYKKKTGAILYDQDGAGKKKAVEIAVVSKNTKLTIDDFFVV